MTEIVLRSGRFRQEREADWRRLEGLLQRVEGGGAGALSEEELLALPKLYRSALSSLSVARAISLDRAMVEYLEGLCARAYFYVYGARARLSRRIARFFGEDWPRAAQRLGWETLVSGIMMLAGAVAAFYLVISDADWFFSFVPEGLAGGRTPSATTEYLRSTLFTEESDAFLSVFATFLFTHNAGIAILAFAVGFAFGMPSLLLMAYNGCTLGAMFAVFWMRGLGVELGGWLLIHGVTELLAVTLAGAAGLRIGRGIAFAGDRTRLESAMIAGREAALVMVGVIIMLFFAGILEGIGRQTINSTEVRYAIAAATAVLWFGYLYIPRRWVDRHGR
jgi:uncharacterized membrane protein SpoIIM required for sporulation